MSPNEEIYMWWFIAALCGVAVALAKISIAQRTTKRCPHCQSQISKAATACPHCTRDVG